MKVLEYGNKRCCASCGQASVRLPAAAMLDGRGEAEEIMADNPLERFFGGSPFWVVVRLVLLSVVIGVLLSVLGFDPWNIWWSLERLVRRIINLGWDAIDSVWRYFILGAVLVFPIWLIVRLARAGSNRS
jgi:hypothetical protein